MKTINHNAPVKCIKSIQINANTVDVWNILTNINNWPHWQTDIKKAGIDGPLLQNTTFYWKSGVFKILSTLHTVEPYTKFGWSGKVLGLYAIHNWTISESKNHVEVTTEESMEGVVAKLFKKSLNKTLEKSLGKWLELLKKECELLEK